jgi:hypothetical protein
MLNLTWTFRGQKCTSPAAQIPKEELKFFQAHDAEFGLTQWPGLIGKLHGQISGGSSPRIFVG